MWGVYLSLAQAAQVQWVYKRDVWQNFIRDVMGNFITEMYENLDLIVKLGF